jgi:hypothetical protein
VDLPEGADASVRLAAIRDAAASLGWQVEAQRGDGGAVRCCYASVAEKLWVFPPVGADGVEAALEFSHGEADEPLDSMGEDLRPSRVRTKSCCSWADGALGRRR